MEITIEQALQQGVAAHKEGKLQEAERIYRAILQFQPAHPDANHNLGLLAVSVNQVEASLPLFKTALEANLKVEQFWLSYIDALIKEKQFDKAKQILEQAKKQGVDGDRLNSIRAQLSAKTEELGSASSSPPQERLNILLGHYQNGRFSDAEKLAVEITQDFPKHQFAWKVLGAVLGATGRKSEAADANQTSVALSPQDFEAHYNLGLTFQELGRFDEAEASYTQALALKPQDVEALNNLGITFKALGRLDEAEASYNQALAFKPDFAEAHNNLGIMLHELGRLDQAINSFKKAIEINPKYAEAHGNLGITLLELGRVDEAEASYNQALAFKPDFAAAHGNLGVTLAKLGRLNEAEASYTQAIALKPDYAEAHNNLGVMLQELGRLDEAEASFGQAISLKPDYAEAHNNLGGTLKELGRLDEALTSYNKAIASKPDYAEAYLNLGIAIKNIRFNSSNRKLYPPLLQLLTTGNFTHPIDMAHSILSLLKHDPLMRDLLIEKNISMSFKEATSIIASLDELTLLHHLMRACPLPDLQFERLFVTMRRFVLTNLDRMEVSPKLIHFLSTLSIHCFTNEYIYVESEEETQLIGELQAKISETMAQSEQPEAVKILCLASYRPLHQYDWCRKLESLDNLEEVKKRLIDEPLLEKMIARDIPVLEKISDDVSLKVRQQYEENPYPRWVKLAIELKAKSISEVCDDANLRLYSENIKNVSAPSILIAGCGTGQHSIGTASRFSNCHVTAVDLSLVSLAYAQRKSNELGLGNLEYLQADILHLHQMGKEFDIIESAGVLHHMDEPMAGWRVLVDLLKPGGLMKIGLYSELARQHIVRVREEIALLRVGTSQADIRKFRQSLAESHDENHQLLTEWGDFFSLSELRDLIFHVQEHRFTLPQIKNCLSELGLKFCGFEKKDIVSRFIEFHGEGSDVSDLTLWHDFEESHPRCFAGMYQFWCQKR